MSGGDFRAVAEPPKKKTLLNRVDACIALCCAYYDAQTTDKWEPSEDWRPWVILSGVLTIVRRDEEPQTRRSPLHFLLINLL